MMILINILLFLLTLFAVGYYFIRKRYSYWTDRNVPFIKPVFPWGCLKGTGTKIHMSELLAKYYNEMKRKTFFCGIYFFINPVVLVLDLDLVKTILVRDFPYFMDHGVYSNEKDDPLSAHLLNMEGNKWRNLRAKLTPTFTSGKMKMMFPTIISVADEFKKVLTKSVERNPVFEIKDFVARFTTDVIGTCAFGLECNSLNDPDAQFRVMGRKMFTVTSYQKFRMFFMVSFKSLAHKLHMKVIPEDVSEFFMKVVRDTIDYRENNNIQGNDFMHLLLQLKNKGKLDDDVSSSELVSLTFEEIAAQAFVIFAAGFETSSTTMSYSLYELALNQDIQSKARQEIETVLTKHDGKLTYEAASEMKYIDQIINETLRKYPPIPNLIRKVTKDYDVPETSCSFKEGMIVIIPVLAIHHDSELYPNPEEFNPDRFSSEEVKKRNTFAFLPFGEGPRLCIGLRFGMMQARIGLVTLLQNFKFTKCSKTVIPLKFSAKDFILTPSEGIFLNVESIKQ